jgi:hypothetical protein
MKHKHPQMKNGGAGYSGHARLPQKAAAAGLI